MEKKVQNQTSLRILRFIRNKLLEASALVVIIVFFYYYGYFIVNFTGATEIVDKCHFKDIGRVDVWCDSFTDWAFGHISLTLLGVGFLFLTIALPFGLYHLIKWNWEITKYK